MPDVAFVNLEFASGTIAHVELSWLAPSKLRRTTIVGSEKMIVYDDTSNEPVRIFDSGVGSATRESSGSSSSPTARATSSRPIEASEPLLLEMLDFCRAVRGVSEPRSNGELGLEVVRVIDAVERSLESGGMPVRVRLGTPRRVARRRVAPNGRVKPGDAAFSIVCLSQSSWAAELPTNRQQIMRRAAERGHEVLFVETAPFLGRRFWSDRPAANPRRAGRPRRPSGDARRAERRAMGARHALPNAINATLTAQLVRRRARALPAGGAVDL